MKRAKTAAFAKKMFEHKYTTDKKYRLVNGNFQYNDQYRDATHRMCN